MSSSPSPLPFSQLVLLPRVSELPGFHGAEAAVRQEELERYQCLEVFRMAPPHPLAEACARLVCSVSALMHSGALREWGACSGQGGALPGAVGQAMPMPVAWWAGQQCQGVGRWGAGMGRCRQGSPGPMLVLLPQPASATRRAPAAASARYRVGSVSASPTSSADAVTAVPQAATASGPWDAAVSSGIFICQESLSLSCLSVQSSAASSLLSSLVSLSAYVSHLSPAVLQPMGSVTITYPSMNP